MVVGDYTWSQVWVIKNGLDIFFVHNSGINIRATFSVLVQIRHLPPSFSVILPAQTVHDRI